MGESCAGFLGEGLVVLGLMFFCPLGGDSVNITSHKYFLGRANSLPCTLGDSQIALSACRLLACSLSRSRAASSGLCAGQAMDL